MSTKATSLDHDEVLDAVARSYRLAGHEVRARWSQNGTDPLDVFLPELRRVEEIETPESMNALDVARLQALHQKGLEVWVVVPLEMIGKAHQLLRGVVDHIQPWWREEEAVRFGHPRIP